MLDKNEADAVAEIDGLTEGNEHDNVTVLNTFAYHDFCSVLGASYGLGKSSRVNVDPS